ncbi:hypothetical protein PILCRDRAFT_303842 [Piloderma croceum F 1598]|uniref:Uncharacterized protein n=1 Tax=Piloderma croceum (strain F 1598) TaxID=765440 RepID=A0A0C3G604_PILCF|nr:hypothetical protein PILCRDRAFT_303842 [Piloderma croceum F 1598]
MPPLGEGQIAMDTRRHQQQQVPNGIPSGYSPLNGSPHTDITLQPTMPSHDMSSVFLTQAGPSNATNGPGPIHVGMADTSNSVKMSSMDFLECTTPVRSSAPDFIPDFPSSNGFGAVPHLNGHTAILSSSSGASSVSSNTSHVPSPGMHGTNTNFSGTSSLASALDDMDSSRSHSGSSASPGNFTNGNSEYAYPSAGNQAPEFHFPPADTAQDRKRGSPDTPADSHLLAIGGLLANISKTAHSARESCIMGNGATAEVRVDELRRTIALVSDLIAATHLVDSPPSHKRSPNYSGVSSNASLSPGEMGSINDHHSRNPSSFSHYSTPNELGVMDIDSGDGSRKRCASSIPGDRVIKAMKLEPQDDVPLHMNSNSANSLHHHGSTYPSMPPFIPSNPPSAPPSRPSSPAGLPSHHTFNPVLQPPPQSFNFQDMNSTSSHFTGHSRGPSSTSTQKAGTAGPPFPSPSVTRMSWSDGPATFPHRQHQHTASGSSLNNGVNLRGLGPSSASIPFTAPGAFGSPPAPQISQQRQGTGMNGVSTSPAASAPLGRVSRSGSVNGSASNPFAFGLPDVLTQDTYGLNYARPKTAISRPQTPVSSPEEEYDYDQAFGLDSGDHSQSHSPSGQRGRSGTDGGGRPTTGHHNHQLPSQPSMENMAQTSSGHGNDVPLEYRSEVDRVFFEFLESICSNLDATDAKGEPIHQTLMAKKMQRLDESLEFRPFKFRIQAFTNAFLEELARQGYPEEKIPMKKIRNYLWNQTYISRFNEDGKKAKSKGNHIWNINAKKKAEGGWLFSPFHRRLAGTPHGVAYVGLRWIWAPRIWDPQASRSNVPVKYASPNLPAWLAWKDDQLSGTPPPDAESCNITVEARVRPMVVYVALL